MKPHVHKEVCDSICKKKKYVILYVHVVQMIVYNMHVYFKYYVSTYSEYISVEIKS